MVSVGFDVLVGFWYVLICFWCGLDVLVGFWLVWDGFDRFWCDSMCFDMFFGMCFSGFWCV